MQTTQYEFRVKNKTFFINIIIILLVLISAGCSSLRHIPEGSYSLEGVSVESDNKEIDVNALSAYIRQKPKTKWFSLIRMPGSRPVLFDSLLASKSANDIKQAVRNTGYLHADVDVVNIVKPNNKKISVKYVVHSGEPYNISDFKYTVDDNRILEIISQNRWLLNPIRAGRRFSIQNLNSTRNQITNMLANNGYYLFNKDYIEFDVDTAYNSTDVDVMMRLFNYKASKTSEGEEHKQYRIRNVKFSSEDGAYIPLRRKVLDNITEINTGDLYSASKLQRTYNNYSRLQAVKYTSIRFTELPDTALLDCDILFNMNKPSTISFQPEGTNTAGDLGAAATLTYSHSNLFRGSELLSIQMRAAFEAISGLEGYNDQNYQEYGIETKITFPRMVMPLLSHNFKRRSTASTELLGSYNLQNRPEYHRRLFTAALRYRWSSADLRASYRFDLIDMNYVYMPWVSETFRRDYLESTDNRNAILRYNYEDMFIMKIGFGITLNHNNYYLRTNIETSGNLLYGISQATRLPKNSQGQYTLFNIAYAQYVKGDIDYIKMVNFDENNQLAIHAALGVAYPYGNSNILPFEKRYFSGGANSVRGWTVRSLGPGNFIGKDGRIDFINQTGDVKLDLSLEYRTKLFWKLNGAVFIDAGNIWTIRDYAEQEGGQLRFNEFYKQIAVAYGLGLRFNFNFFILRFDFGMKAVNPAYTTDEEHFPILRPNLKRDLAFHFAVGLPF